MSKKNNVTTSVELNVTNFEGVDAKLTGIFLGGRASAKVGGYPIFVGQIDVSENLETLSLLAHGSKPTIETNEKGEESPGDIPTCPTTDEPLWKYVKGVKKDKTSGKMVPIQSVYNRDTKPGHVDTLVESVDRVGVDTKRRMVSFLTHPTTGQTHPVDGGHILTAMAQANIDDDSILTIQVLCPQNVDSYAECLAGFDELQNERQVKDVLKAAGICPGWDSEAQVILNKLVLLVSGKGIDSSGSSVPHIGANNAKGKWTPRKLSKSEIAMLVTKDFPGVERVVPILHLLNTPIAHSVTGDDGKPVKAETPLFDYPTFRKCKIPAWVLAITECSYSAGLDVETIVGKLCDIITDDLNPIIAKLNSWATGRVEDDFAPLCSILFAVVGQSELGRTKPKSRSTHLIQVAYNTWNDLEQAKQAK